MQMRDREGETGRLAQWQTPIWHHTKNSSSAISFRVCKTPRDLHRSKWSRDAKSQQLLDRACLHQLLSGPGRTVRVHLDFLPVSPLPLFAVTLENGAQPFSPCSHLDGGVTSPLTWSCNSYGLFSLGSLKYKQEKVCPTWDGTFVFQSRVPAPGLEAAKICRAGNWKCFIVCVAVALQSRPGQNSWKHVSLAMRPLDGWDNTEFWRLAAASGMNCTVSILLLCPRDVFGMVSGNISLLSTKPISSCRLVFSAQNHLWNVYMLWLWDAY